MEVETYTYQGKDCRILCKCGTIYLVIPEGVYRSMNPEGKGAYGYLWVDCDKRCCIVEQSLNTLISNTSHIKMDTHQLHSYNLGRISRSRMIEAWLYRISVHEANCRSVLV